MRWFGGSWDSPSRSRSTQKSWRRRRSPRAGASGHSLTTSFQVRRFAASGMTAEDQATLLRQPFLQPSDNHVGDLVGMLTGRAPHMVAFGIDPRRFRIAVLHQEINVGDRRLVVELAVDAQKRRGFL